MTCNDLTRYCLQFGLKDIPGGNRWNYVEALFQYAIDSNRCDELFNFFFDLSHFKNFQGFPSLNIPPVADEDIETLHEALIEAAIIEINRLICLTRHELRRVDGHYFVTALGQNPPVYTSEIDKFSTEYVANLRERCKDDLQNGHYDSVITKSRTMIEETLTHIVEEAEASGFINEAPDKSGHLEKLYNQVKRIKNMHQLQTNDKRINEFLSGLEKIVNSIASMRNVASDAHGVGQRRININPREAALVMNASIVFCEYMVSVKD